jgi:hypothetical protein
MKAHHESIAREWAELAHQIERYELELSND